MHSNIGCIAGSKLAKNLKYVRDLRELDLSTRDLLIILGENNMLNSGVGDLADYLLYHRSLFYP